MAPITLEAILFLKMNRDLWDEKSVSIAYTKVIKADKEKRLDDKMKKLKQQVEDLDLDGSDYDDDSDDEDEGPPGLTHYNSDDDDDDEDN